MTFDDARGIEQVVWSMRLSDYQRGLNRARINSLANGAPPYTEEEEKANKIAVNVNDLTMTRLSHDARMQLYQAFTKPGNFFTCRTDMGTSSKRLERGVTVTTGINKFLKRSDAYFETLRSKFALQVMHGIGPSVWPDADSWCPSPVGVEDVMVPSNTLLTFANLPFFAVWHGFAAHELLELTSGDKVDPGWNIPVVKEAVAWAERETAKLYGGSRWSEYWSPEKAEERMKQSSGIYASDLVQTIDCWDFYFRDDDGWKRRIVFDAYGGAGAWQGAAGYGAQKSLPTKNLLDKDKGQFLYNGGDRIYAEDLCQLIHFQFADLSSNAPFRYHSVRSLGFLLFAACHLQNRLRCKMSEAVFENLMNYMRVNSLDDAERALKVELASHGLIDSSISFLQPNERWQPNPQLAELGLNEYKQVIADNSSSYVQNQNFSRDRVEKTKFQVMAEVNAMTTLVSSALQQAYRYQASEYREIVRRFLNPKSQCKDVKKFQEWAKARKVPEALLNDPEAWDVEPERVVGGGNKTLEMAIAQQLMEWRAAYSPEGQQQVLRLATLSITDDAALTNQLVPEKEQTSDATHAAMLAFGSLMAGGVVDFPPTLNRPDIIEALLAELAWSIRRTLQMGGMATPQEIVGFRTVLTHLADLIAQIAQDKQLKERAKRYANESGKLANEVKGFEQRLAAAQKKAGQNGDNGQGAETAAKVAATMATTQAKILASRESRAEKAASRQVEFEQQQAHREQEHRQDLQHQAQDQAVKLAGDAAKLEMQREAAAAAPASESGD